VLGLLREMGYGAPGDDAVAHLGKTSDEGVDGVIYQDELKLESIYVQAKRYGEGNTVSREQVQAFVGFLVGKNADKGVYFTTSTFSAQAQAYADGVHQSVILIDGTHLAGLMFDRGVGVRIKKEFVIKSVDEAYFEPE
jgi:restriction system protein